MKYRIKQLESLRCAARRLPIILLIAAFFLTAAPGTAAEPTPPSTTAISPAEVATRATELATFLDNLTTNLAPSPEIETIQQALPEVSTRIEQEFAGTVSLLQQQPTFETLQAQQQSWQRRQLKATGWLNLVTQRAVDLREGLSRLATLQTTWNNTLDTARTTASPEPILQQIEATVAAIKAAQASLQAQQSTILDLQSHIAGEVARCNDALSQIAQAQRNAVGGLFTRALPIWSAELWRQARTEGVARFRRIVTGQWADFEQYLYDPSQNLPLHLGVFTVMALLMVVVRRRVQRWTAADKRLSFTTTVFEHPYAAAFVTTLLVVSAPNLPTPPTVRNLVMVMGLVPMIRLVRPAVNPRLVHGLYALGVLYALDTVREAFAGAPLVEPALLLLETFLGMAVLGWSLAGEDLRQPSAQDLELAWLSTLRAGAGLILLVLAAGLVSGVLGYLRLARLLVSSVLGGGFLALVLAASIQVLGGLLAIALRVRPLRRLQMVRHHRNLLERRGYRLLVWLAVAGWLARWLDYIGLFQPALSFLESVMSARFERGAISLSLGDIVAFLLTVWVAFLLSVFLRFVLQEEVYPSKGISRGSSYAISSLLHYAILTLGFLVGLGILGMDFTKVSVLLGALGVGIGFGLQSVVNNFISGLILLFERPIHVGDIIEVGDLQGEVRRIGIRASTVRTDRGADIIVPNGQFISANVTNWTLNDQLQRLDLPVSVTYRVAVQEVIKLLETVAAADPRVLQQPSPQGLFVSYGDKSLGFELRVWTDRFDDAPLMRSELTKALYAALIAARMAAPLPQGDTEC
ncbi:MAG: mechanosensitive ion channel [Candidatus Competibacteraceae bacterium]